ncbi:MAG TPA: hypothetical protein VMR33_04315 [Candidatus Baltobacteraceae bacterium]|jgi:hypothetical protein|nr:hypothetical protein [Candidatus Baltobacteraceae bacterium]
MRKSFLLFGLLIPAVSLAQSYSISWYKVAGGGGTSSGTNGASAFSVSGTIGQPDAGGAMTGGGYSVTGGFWSLISVVQTPGAPTLNITYSGGSVIISWPYTSTGFVLQQNSNLSAANWMGSSFAVSSNGSSNSVTITSPSGNLFFRLSNR